MDNWEIVNNQVKRSKIQRLNWNNIFNESLSKKCAALYNAGKSSEEAYNIIKQNLINKGYIPHYSKEIYRRLKIGVAARYGEIKSELSKINITCPNCKHIIVGGKK